MVANGQLHPIMSPGIRASFDIISGGGRRDLETPLGTRRKNNRHRLVDKPDAPKQVGSKLTDSTKDVLGFLLFSTALYTRYTESGQTNSKDKHPV